MSAGQQSYDRPSPGACSLGDDSGTDIFYDTVEVLSLSNRLKDFGLYDGHKYAQNRGSSTFDVDSSMPEVSDVKTEPAVWTDAKIGDFLFSQIWCNAYQSMTDEEDRDSLDDQEWSDVMMENSDILCPSTSPGCDSSVGCGLPEEGSHDVPDDRESMKPPVSGYPTATEADVPLLEDDPTGVNWDPPFNGWPSVSSWMSANHTIIAETDQPPPASAPKDHNANSPQTSQTSPVPLEESRSAVNSRDSSVLNELGAGETRTSERTALDDSVLLPAQVSCLPCNPEEEDWLIPRSAGCDSNVTGIIIPFGEMATAGISVEENGFILSTFLERNEERRVLVCTIDEVVKMPEYQDISQEQQTAELESRTSSEVPVLALSRPGEDVREGEEREATGLPGHPGGLADGAFVCVEAECFSLSTAPLLNTGEDPGEDPGEAVLLACKSQSKQEGDSESQEPRVYSQVENRGNTSIITASALSDGTGLLQAQGSTISPFRRGSTNQTMQIPENGQPLKGGNEKMWKGQTEKTVCSQSQEAARDLEVFYNTSFEKGPAEIYFSSLNKGVHSASVLNQEMSNMIMLTSDSQMLSKDHGVVYLTLDLPETSIYDFPFGIEDVNLKMPFKKSLKKEKDENICKTEPRYSFGAPPLATETSSGLRTLRSREAATHPVKAEETDPRTLGTGGYRTINAPLPEISGNLDGPISATEGILTPEPHEKMQEKQSLTPSEKKKLVKGKVLAFEEKWVPQKVPAVTKPPAPFYKKDGLGLDVRAEDGLVVGSKGEKRSAGGNGSLTTDTVSVVSEYCLTMGEVAEGTTEDVKCTPLLFRQDFLCEQYFGENQPASIMTERVHFGEGMHRRAFRSRFLDGVRPVFTPGQSCVLKVHTAVTQGTQGNEELVCKNYNLAVEECSVQNTAREYIKAYREVAEAAQMFGEVPEIIPVYLVHRPTNDIPYATLEEELPGNFVKYSVRDGKEINLTRRDTEAGQKCCAFQHWVFHKTEGNLLVTDMQGVGMKLTDVGIATCKKGYKGFRGNCATSFIDQFKALHQCNKFCELLGLISLHGAQPKPRRMATELNTKTKAQPRKKTLAPSPKNTVA